MKVIDASVAVKLLILEERSDEASRLWQTWADEAGELVVAPPLLTAEAISALRRRVYRKLIGPEDGNEALGILWELRIDIIEPPGLYERAWRLAHDFDRPNIYDCCYLALAELANAQLWTADERLANAVGDRFPLIRLLGRSDA